MAGKGTSSPGVQFRTACDPCSAAKVRCDKNHPVCERCAELRRACVYTESRKHGKQLWRKRLNHERARAPEASEDHSPQATTTSSLEEIITTSLQLDQMGWNMLLDPATMSLPPSSIPATSLMDIQGLASHDQTEYRPTNHLTPQSLGDEPAGFGADMNPFSHWSFNSSSPATTLQSKDRFSVPQLRQDDPGLLMQGLVEDPGSTSTVSRTSASTVSRTSSHDCEGRAVIILRSMQHGEMQRNATSCDTDPVTVFTSFNLAPSLDSVLAVNKAALDGWNQLLKCSCASCPHLTLLYTAILSKMLFWYRVAGTENDSTSGADSNSSEHEARTRAGSSVSSSPSDSPPSAGEFSVRMTAMQFGKLDLDAEDQANMRRMLLLRELRKMAKSMDTFMGVDRLVLERDAAEPVRRSLLWAIGGFEKIREELQEMLDTL